MDSPTPPPTPAAGEMPPQPVEVSAGLIFRDGRLLITQRYPDAHLGGLWEFPGGKLEQGEGYEAALQRELREELGVEICVGPLLDAIEHVYSSKPVRIQFYRCQIKAGRPLALGCNAVKWVSRDELSAHAFPAADARLLDRLHDESALWDG